MTPALPRWFADAALKLRLLPVAGRGFDRLADGLHARDRSFFYRSLHPGRKR